MLGLTRRLDARLAESIHRRPHAGLDSHLPRLSRAADHALLWLVVSGLLAVRGRWQTAVRAMCALVIADVLADVPDRLPISVRSRPDRDRTPHHRRPEQPPAGSAFPSGHAAAAAAFATTIARREPAHVALPIVALAGAVGYSRLHSGVHWPSDVLAGVALGVAVATGVQRLRP